MSVGATVRALPEAHVHVCGEACLRVGVNLEAARAGEKGTSVHQPRVPRAWSAGQGGGPTRDSPSALALPGQGQHPAMHGATASPPQEPMRAEAGCAWV